MPRVQFTRWKQSGEARQKSLNPVLPRVAVILGELQFKGASEDLEGCRKCSRAECRVLSADYLKLDRASQPFFSSINTCRAISFSVSNTPLPWKATASNTGSPRLVSSVLSSSTGMALGRSRLFNCNT